VETDDVRLISRLSNEFSPLVEEQETGTWDLRSLPFIQYYYYTDQLNELTSYVDKRFASDRTGDHRWLYGAASQIIDMDQQYMTEDLLMKGKEWFQACIDLDEQFDYYFYHGMVLFLLHKKDAAKDSFEKAGILAENEEQSNMIKQVMGFVNGQ
jgi:hypothetical protein